MAFCSRCGAALEEGDRFCYECGAPVRSAAAAVPSPPASASARPMFQATTDSEPASLAEPSDRRVAQPLWILIVLLIILAAGISGYRWISDSAENRASIETVATEQAIEPPQSATGGAIPGSATPNISRERLPSVQWMLLADATTGTVDATNAIGSADGRVAAIQPGGSMALERIEAPFYNGDGPDIRVDGPAGHRVPYILFTRTGSQDGWEQFDVNRKGFSAGSAVHDFGHHGIEHARQIMIRNEGVSPLYIDALTPLHLERERDRHDEPQGHKD